MDIRKVLKKLTNPYKVLERLLRAISPLIKNDELYSRMRYYLCMHKPLNLNPPITFNEKLQWLKLYNRNPKYTVMVDKFEVFFNDAIELKKNKKDVASQTKTRKDRRNQKKIFKKLLKQGVISEMPKI